MLRSFPNINEIKIFFTISRLPRSKQAVFCLSNYFQELKKVALKLSAIHKEWILHFVKHIILQWYNICPMRSLIIFDMHMVDWHGPLPKWCVYEQNNLEIA